MFHKSPLWASSPQRIGSSSRTSLLVAILMCIVIQAPQTLSSTSLVRGAQVKTNGLSQDQSRASAERLVEEAERLKAEGTAEAQKKALDKFQEALPLWRDAGDLKGEATTLNNIAAIYHGTGDAKAALEASDRALKLFQGLGDHEGEVKALIRIGNVHYDIGEQQKALDSLNQALDVLKQSPDQKLEAAALNVLGNVYDAMGEPRRAMDYLSRSLALRRAIGDQAGEAFSLADLGMVHSSLGELQAALDYYTQALPFFHNSGDLQSEAVILNNIAATNGELGERQKALEYYSKALTIRRAAGDRRGEGITIANIGANYYTLGENERALEEYNRALSIFQELQDKVGETRVLERIAIVYSANQESQKAIEIYNNLLEIWRARKDKRFEGTTLLRIGRSYYGLKNYALALDYLMQSLEIAREVKNLSDEAEILQILGAVYRSTGKLEQSVEAYQQALNIYRQTGLHREVVALFGSARTEILRGNLDTARKQIEQAIDLTESLRAKLSSLDLRISVLADNKKYYETYVDVLMRMHEREPDRGYDAKALQIHELASARGLLDLLNEARADIRQGGDPVLLNRERTLQQQLNEKERYRISLTRARGKEKQVAEVEEELSRLLSQYRETQAEIRARSPQYAALTQPRPLELREIQTQVLDSDTVLLEYALGDERSYLWFVSENSYASFVLPGREEIERQARRFYDLLSVNPAAESTDSPNPAAKGNYTEAAIALGKMLLGPIADRLAGKRLLIVSDGALQYVTFGALHKPLAGKAGISGRQSLVPLSRHYRPLIFDNEVVMMPSASTVAFLRSESSGRKRATKTVAVLADPVFGRDDSRMSASKEDSTRAVVSSSAVDIVKSSARDSGLGDFTRLRFSRREAESITSLVPKESSLQALDFAASRVTAQSTEMADYRILHFATHGLLNSKHPELSGLVLSLVDEQGKDVDGFLRFYEIYNLKLNADLIVLSACQTALGKEVSGEGLIGLTRGFMYAGAQRVVASLWRVDDHATAELMKRFYQGMLTEGLRPSAALRAAQISMLKDRRWVMPHYWAAFTIQGEWR